MIGTTTVTTIERFIIDQEHKYPEATGELSNLLYDIALGAKLIAAATRRAGLVNILGAMGNVNIQGEEQQKLDVFANEILKNALNHTGRVCVMASEEDDDPIPIPPEYPAGKYVVLFDPLDGSSNIDSNASVGTIFSVYRRVSMEGRGTMDDVLQPGHQQVAAGYVIYGSSTMLVYTTGQGVHGFTLDPTIGEFLLSHPKIMTPEVGKYYSVNESNYRALEPREPDGGARVSRRHPRTDEGQEQPVHRLVRGRLSSQPDQRRHFPVSRPTPRTRTASCACSTSAAQWPSWPNRPAGRPPTARVAFSTCSLSRCTSGCRWPSARRRTSSSSSRRCGNTGPEPHDGLDREGGLRPRRLAR